MVPPTGPIPSWTCASSTWPSCRPGPMTNWRTAFEDAARLIHLAWRTPDGAGAASRDDAGAAAANRRALRPGPRRGRGQPAGRLGASFERDGVRRLARQQGPAHRGRPPPAQPRVLLCGRQGRGRTGRGRVGRGPPRHQGRRAPSGGHRRLRRAPLYQALGRHQRRPEPATAAGPCSTCTSTTSPTRWYWPGRSGCRACTTSPPTPASARRTPGRWPAGWPR